jgi:hypothetical protein
VVRASSDSDVACQPKRHSVHRAPRRSYGCPQADANRVRVRAALRPHSVQSQSGASPASGHSPTGPSFRANPYPEVTDRFCRLPLPTLFYQLEAVNLGDLLRISVRLTTEVDLAFGFSRADSSAPDPARTAGLFGVGFHISRQAVFMEWTPYREKTTLPGAAADVSKFDRVTAFAPESAPSVSEFGNINPMPFREIVHRINVSIVVSGVVTAFAAPLGPTDPCSTAVHMEPFSTLVLKILT